MLLIKEKESNLIEKSLNQYRMFPLLLQKIKSLFLFVTCLLASLQGITQTNNDKKITPAGFSKTISAGIAIPSVEFNQTHGIGPCANFSWSKHRFGILDKKPSKSLGFIADAGIDYYPGKNKTVSNYQYKYNAFTYIHTYGGAIYNCGKRGNINLTTGPALGLENGFTTFFWGVNLNGAYYIKKNIAVTPGIQYMQDLNAPDPLLSFSIRASFVF